MTGVQDPCRRCGHGRGLHSSGPQVCLGFLPVRLTWRVEELSVEPVDGGRGWSGLPSPAAALQLAEALSDVDELLARVAS